ncbi:MAG: amidohydrolase family protein [Gammaproteobacteria bacterium]|nr:amidohydrolase family protein [Gammaproteobacteria bacterium]
MTLDSPAMDHLANASIKRLSVLAMFVCFNVLGNVDFEHLANKSVTCSLVQSTKDSNQTILVGKLVGYRDTQSRAILVERGVIQNIGVIEEIRARAPYANVINCNDGYISAGFVNAHEHPPYSAGKPGPNVSPVYSNRYQWQGSAGDQYPEIAYSRVENDAQLFWVELRHLLAGTTTMAGNGAVPGLLKNVGSGDKDVGFVYEADMKTFPFPQAIDEFNDLPLPYSGPSVEPELTEGVDTQSPYIPHIAEGKDDLSRVEAQLFLDYVERNPGRRFGLIHGVGLSRSDVPRMRSLDVTLIWAPRSNLALYGETVDVPHLLENDVRVALSTDWSYSGSYNMLESFKCAQHVVDERWNSGVSAKVLWRMATENGAYALDLEEKTGALKPGLAADLVIVKAKTDDPFADLIASEVADVMATFVDGKLVTGDRSAFDLSELPASCSNFVGDYFVCDDLSERDFTWQQLLAINEDAVPLFESEGQASCSF